MDFLPAPPPPPLAEPPFRVEGPLPPPFPLLLTSPHSGRFYPPDFLSAARLDLARLRRSEDAFVDAIAAAGPPLGIPLLAGHYARVYCDVNRERWELDPDMFADPLPDFVTTATPKLAAGLGTLPKLAARGEPIYREKLPFSEAERRVRGVWEPFHAELAALIEMIRKAHGGVVLLDCHSMPELSLAGLPPADIVLGDAHGQSADPSLVGRLAALFTAQGLRVRRNHPYAGGYITRHYGRPAAGVHVVQIEMARRLYMDEQTLSAHAGLARLRTLFGDVLAKLRREIEAWLPSPQVVRPGRR
jgi:N-formylglutamate amidohydrolase